MSFATDPVRVDARWPSRSGLLVTGRYPQSIAGLMIDQYPPFRLDQGGDDPRASRLTVPPPTRQAPTP